MSKLINLVPREKRLMHELKTHCTINEWNQFRAFISEVLGLNEEASAVTDDQIAALLVKIGKELKKSNHLEKPIPTSVDTAKLEKGDESGIQTNNKSELKESLTVTLLLAAPTILELLGKLVDWLYAKFALSGEKEKEWKAKKEAFNLAKQTGKDINGKKLSDDDIHHMEEEIYASWMGKWIQKAGHALHLAYVAPLRVLIAGVWYLASDESWMYCWKKALKPANIVYAIAMFLYAGYSGLHAVADMVGTSVANLGELCHSVVDLVKSGDNAVDIFKALLGDVHI